jgi:hypothetical protein
MSKLSAIAAILTITLQLTACAQQRDLDPPPVVPAHIIGTMVAPFPEEIRFVYCTSLAELCEGHVTRVTARPDSNGRFEITLPISSVTLWGKAGTAFFDNILPGDTVHITEYMAGEGEERRIKESYTGDDFSYSAFANEFNTARGVDRSLLEIASDRTLPDYFMPDEFMALADRRRDTLQALAPVWLKRHHVRPEVQEYFRSMIDYSWGLEHLRYVDDALHYARTISLRGIQAEFLERIRDLANRPQTAYSAGPRATDVIERFLTLWYLRDLARHTPEETTIDTTLNGRALLDLAQKLLTGESRDMAGTIVIRMAVASARSSVPGDSQMRMRAENNPDSLLRMFDAFCTRRQYYDKAANLVNRWHRIAPGMPAPAATLEDTAGRKVSLLDLRGKPVFYFFWAPKDYSQVLLDDVTALNKRFGDSITIVCIAAYRYPDSVRKELRWHHFDAVQLIDPREGDENLVDIFHIDPLGLGTLLDADGNIVIANAYMESLHTGQAIERLLARGRATR